MSAPNNRCVYVGEGMRLSFVGMCERRVEMMIAGCCISFDLIVEMVPEVSGKWGETMHARLAVGSRVTMPPAWNS